MQSILILSNMSVLCLPHQGTLWMGGMEGKEVEVDEMEEGRGRGRGGEEGMGSGRMGWRED